MTGHRPFAELKAKLPPESRRRAEARAAELRAEMPLHALRAALELSQSHLAEVLKVDQPAVSRMERRADMMIGTLRRFVEAMGGRLELRATFPTGDVIIEGLGELRTEPQTPRRGEKRKRA